MSKITLYWPHGDHGSCKSIAVRESRHVARARERGKRNEAVLQTMDNTRLSSTITITSDSAPCLYSIIYKSESIVVKCHLKKYVIVGIAGILES
jgi:hypothetical protein